MQSHKKMNTAFYKLKQNIPRFVRRLGHRNRDCNYNLRKNNFLNRQSIESVSFLAPKIWDNLPKERKGSKKPNTFKPKIIRCFLRESPCRLRETYLPQVEFI